MMDVDADRASELRALSGSRSTAALRLRRLDALAWLVLSLAILLSVWFGYVSWSQAVRTARTQFNATLQALEVRLRSAPFPDVLQEARDSVMDALQRARTEGEAAGREALAQLELELQANELRQRELVECALDETALRALLVTLGDATPVLRVLEFEQGGIAGWAVSARRA